MAELTRAYILAVATEEAALACASISDTLGMAIGPHAKLARRRALARILRETECAPRRLARLWGCDPCVVFRLGPQETSAAPYDPDTARRLQWVHGYERASAILEGLDPATLTDIAAWRRVGGRSAA